MELKQEYRQEQTQRLTQEQKLLLESAKKNIGYIEYDLARRTYWEYEDGEIKKKIRDINGEVDDTVPDVLEFISRRK